MVLVTKLPDLRKYLLYSTELKLIASVYFAVAAAEIVKLIPEKTY